MEAQTQMGQLKETEVTVGQSLEESEQRLIEIQGKAAVGDGDNGNKCMKVKGATTKDDGRLCGTAPDS